MSRLIWYVALLLCALLGIVTLVSNMGIGVKGDVEFCQKANGTQLDSCFNQLAERKGYPVCKHLEPIFYKDCVVHSAMGRDHWRTCKKLDTPTEFNECVGKVGLFNNDKDVLERIEDKLIREDWLKKVALRHNSSLACRAITDVNVHGSCYKEMAESTQDEEFCYLIDQTSIHRDECFYSLALSKRDTGICGPMESIRKDNCLIEAAK